MTVSVYHDSGAVDFQLMDGQLLPVQSIPDVYQRLGGAGESVQVLGTVAPDCEVVAHFLTTSFSLAKSSRDRAAAWQSKYVRVTDSTSTVFVSVLCKQVTARIFRGRYAHNGTTYTFRVEARMTLSVQP